MDSISVDAIMVHHGGITHSLRETEICEVCKKCIEEFEEAKRNGAFDRIINNQDEITNS